MIAAYNRRLFSGNKSEETRYAKVWTAWESALASMQNTGGMMDSPPDYAHAFARLENHYFMNHAFLERDDQILRNMPRIAHIPGTIVQGRHDMICPPRTAWKLHESWPASELHMIHMAGHALSERGITDQLVTTMDRLRTQLG